MCVRLGYSYVSSVIRSPKSPPLLQLAVCDVLAASMCERLLQVEE